MEILLFGLMYSAHGCNPDVLVVNLVVVFTQRSCSAEALGTFRHWLFCGWILTWLSWSHFVLKWKTKKKLFFSLAYAKGDEINWHAFWKSVILPAFLIMVLISCRYVWLTSIETKIKWKSWLCNSVLLKLHILYRIDWYPTPVWENYDAKWINFFLTLSFNRLIKCFKCHHKFL